MAINAQPGSVELSPKCGQRSPDILFDNMASIEARNRRYLPATTDSSKKSTSLSQYADMKKRLKAKRSDGELDARAFEKFMGYARNYENLSEAQRQELLKAMTPSPPPTRTLREGGNVGIGTVLVKLLKVTLTLSIYLAMGFLLMMALLTPFRYVLGLLGFIALPFIIASLSEQSGDTAEDEDEQPKLESSAKPNDTRAWLADAEADAVLGEVATKIGAQLTLMDKLMPGQEQTQAFKDATNLMNTDLPKLIEFYENVPEELRNSDYLGESPDQTLANGLQRVSRKIDALIAQLKQAPLDELAIHGRMLDYQSGEADGLNID